MRKRAMVIGYSGHAYVVIDILLSNKYKVTAYCERALKLSNPYTLEYLGSENETEVLKKLVDFDVFLGIGDNIMRKRVFKHISAQNLSCPFVIHQRAYISPFCEIGEGTVVMPSAVLNSKSVIGKAVICNSSCIIEHECKVGDYSHIGPGAVLSGNVIIGEGTFIGANAVVKPGVVIGSNVIIGAGSVVTKDMPDGVVAYGNPARIN